MPDNIIIQVELYLKSKTKYCILKIILFYCDVSCFSINVIVRRVGGSYGGKISRSSQIACSAALVSHLLGRTCRFILPLMTNMKVIGKRIGTSCKYEVNII